MKNLIRAFSASHVCNWFFLVVISTVCSLPLQAQTIADNAFASAIREVCPTCIDASNKLLAPATTLTSLDVSNKGIADLSGIEGFTSLKSLNCYSNKLTQLPALPSTLTTLQCDVNQITTLAKLPAGLINLSCSYNQLPFLPNLPSTLTALACNNNQLTELPALPSSLTTLTCSNNQLNSLPNSLPASLKTLFCLSNKLSQLPTLPGSLTTLYCQENQISCLPALPSSLSVLYLDADKIGCLPNAVSGLKIYNAKGNLVEGLGTCVKINDPKFADAIRSSCPSCIDNCNSLTPNAASLQNLYVSNAGVVSLEGIEQFSSLVTLSCARNVLKTLPDNLPASLKDLSIDYNQLTTLPKLPSGLTRLNCSNNQFTTIQNLPASLEALFCNENKLTQLPTLPSNLTYLNCQYNLLTTLPTLPPTLITLIANNNKLTSLPSLPNKLQQVEVGYNQLTKLPTLPEQLYSLDCNNNLLECLPTLPSGMRSLNINNNKIACVPNKPSGIYIILSGVNVPVCGFSDLNLTASVRQICSACFDECGRPNSSEISKIKTLDLSNKNISNIAEIELFTSLETLNLSNNPSIKCISNVPASLTSLTIDTTTIRCLPSILPSLKVYSSLGGLLVNFPTCFTIKDPEFIISIRNSCNNCINECNQLTPAAGLLRNLSCSRVQDFTHLDKFASLTEFSCFYCLGTELPKLPESLRTLNWVYGGLVKVSNLPKDLYSLNLSNNNISAIDTLPMLLNDINVSSNQIKSLKNLPNSIKVLDINNNQIEEIERLPSDLTTFYCTDNLLKSLPSIPQNLHFLNCSNNKLTSIPQLPEYLELLLCNNNVDLACLPLLPNSLRQLSIEGNSKIKCLPNKVANQYFFSNLPVCGIEDINLVKAIKEQCLTCVDDCFNIIKSEAEKIKSIDLTNKQITNLNGIEQFINLETLILADIPTNCITALPASLTSLTINPVKITCLPAHNAKLKVYNLEGQLIAIPAPCTNRISDLNFIKAIRQQCPGCLDECNNLLPPSQLVQSFSFYNSNIKDITGIHHFNALKSLYLTSNQITFLPKLPASLIELEVSNNLVEKIENLPNSLTRLSIVSNKITKIDSLPLSLEYFNCSSNNLESLPPLPLKLYSLSVQNNPLLRCLPTLPQSLNTLYIGGSPLITCVPNKPPNIIIYNGGLPIDFCGFQDVNLQKAIKEICPNCIDECQKLVTSELNKITALNLSNKNISSLIDIGLFMNLDSLIISNNPTICLSPLPSTINAIVIDTSTIKCLISSNPNLRVYAGNGQRIPKPSACRPYIRDLNFANAIRENCPSCIDDCNFLLPTAETTSYLSVSYKNITDLTGIEGFKTLRDLYVNGNLLKTLPTLPPTLKLLEVRNNLLQSVTSLHDNITQLYISNNAITQLPVLPSQLQRLDISNNKITSISSLPTTLTELRCSNNQITCLPALPFSLTYLQFDHKKIGCLKNLKVGVSLQGADYKSFATYPECSNPILLSEVTSALSNPVPKGITVPLSVKRNYTGTVAVKWQRKRTNESDYSDLKLDTITTTTNTDFTYEINGVSMADNGSNYRLVITSACSGTFTAKAYTLAVKDESINPPTITVSPSDTVCLTQVVTLTSNCPAGTTTVWNNNKTGPSIQISSSSVSSTTISARCELGTFKSEFGLAKTVAWKPFNVTLINVGKSKSAVKEGTNVPLSAWASQFVTPDAGPTLVKSDRFTPSVYYVENPNKPAPRYWTAYVDVCGIDPVGSISFDLLVTPETGAPMSFNTHENNAPYLMYANRDGFTELYAQNHPYFGFYLDNGNNQNSYDSGLPKGLYKLSIRYWLQKGLGITPSVRVAQGTALTYQEHWFRIQSKSGVGNGSARLGQEITENSSAITVSPNPATHTVNLTVKQAKNQEVLYEWVDVAGKVHRKASFRAETDAHTELIDITNYPTGMYFLRVTTPTQRVNLKVTKLD